MLPDSEQSANTRINKRAGQDHKTWFPPPTKYLKAWTIDQKVEEGIRETDRGRQDEIMGNEKKYDGTEANIYLVECRTGEEADGWSGLGRRRIHKAESLILGESG
jgi:hypothetical protein